MKIKHLNDFEHEIEMVLKFHSDRRWDEYIKRLGATDPFEPGYKDMETLIQKKHILKMIKDLKLLIEKAEKDVRD